MAQVAVPRDRRSVTILFADVVGSTALIERADAETAHRILAPVISEIVGVVERYGGHVSEVQGDGLLAIFGAPKAVEDHPVQACRAALAIQAALATRAGDAQSQGESAGQSLRLRVGLSSGVVLVTTEGDGPHAVCHAVGIPVHLAARVQAVTPPGGIGLSRHANDRVCHAFHTELLGEFDLKGFSSVEPIYLLRASRAAAETKPLPASPFLGRRPELELALQRVSLLGAGTGGVLLVEGEAGIGKSRLVSEVKAKAPDGVAWFSAHWTPYEQGIGYKPFVDIIGALLGPPASAERPAWTPFAEALDRFLGEDAEQTTPYLAVLFGVDVPPPWDERVRYLAPDVLGSQVRGAVRRLLLRHVLAQPLVIVLEDLHWADESSVALLEHLLPLTNEAPLLFILTSRPEAEHLRRLADRAGELNADSLLHLKLSPLDAADSSALLDFHMGTAPGDRYLRQQVLSRTGGNPFFIQELVHNVRAAIRSGPATERTVPDGGAPETVPETIEEVILARVDRLKIDTRQLLMRAAVIGREFLEKVLRMLEDVPRSIVPDLVDLEHQQFIREAARNPELAYVFCHALTQQAIYDSMLTDTRKRLHRRVADALESIYAGRTQDIAAILAFHYARAEVRDKALEFLLRAAQDAERSSADVEALRYYEQALRALESAPKGDTWQHAFIRRRLGVLHSRRGNFERAESYFADVLALFDDTFPPRGRAARLALVREFVRHLISRLFRRPPLPTEDATDEATEQHMRAYEGLAWLMMQVDQDRLLYATLRVLNLAEGSRWRESTAKALGAVGFSFDVLGMHTLAFSYHHRAGSIARQSKDLAAQALVEDLLGGHYLFTGDWDRALERLRRAQEIAFRIGDLDTWASACGWQCLLLCERGNLADVRALADALLDAARDTGFAVAERWGHLFQGAYLRRAGRLVEAEASLRRALEAGTACGDVVTQADACGELGVLALRSGRQEAARALLEMGQALVRQRRIRIQTVVPIEVGLAEAAVLRAQSVPVPTRSSLRRRCSKALATARRYSLGTVWALRVLAKSHELEGERRLSLRYWEEALTVSRRLKATYEEALTLIEFGEMRKIEDHRKAGDELLARCVDTLR